MSELPKERLLSLREKIDQQRNTIEALKRDGHECADAERQLRHMLAELRTSETVARRMQG
ncbi:MAG TPA: hypothetical protein VGV41_04605 [Pseudolabrys sp.]|uniref:hypothetical protein n=1 Tax=Pseudolabrys sp. TaxID=1960880 RepID=UPI002DDDB013|nr:hypothetical protein [Pseudolabrys sp.]HEV2627905.1 hypothetical protein [Pseudolabrys sp.]